MNCNHLTEFHVGPIEADVAPDQRGVTQELYLYDVCQRCGYVWPISWLSPERADQYRRAIAADRAARDQRRRP